MSIQLGIIDQRVIGLAERFAGELPKDKERAQGMAFLLLGVATVLDLDEEDALPLITDGPDDIGIDAIHYIKRHGRLDVTLFQAKYHRGDKRGVAAFPTNEIGKLIGTIARVFDPSTPLHANPKLLERLEDVRSMIRDGDIPEVRVVLLSNGRSWDANGEALVDPTSSGLPEDQVRWEHQDADSLLSLLQDTRPVHAELHLAGNAFIEDDFAFRRVLVGRLPVRELERLMTTYGDRLLERNIRRFLGMRNRVNVDIAASLRDPKRRPDFFFLNNGITMVCKKFEVNRIQKQDWTARVDGLHLVNGGQTAMTVRQVLSQLKAEDFSRAHVMVRIYEIAEEDRDFMSGVTWATNNQSPVDLRDLHANDPVQERIAVALEGAGFHYARKRGERRGPNSITPEALADALLCTRVGRPEWVRGRKAEHFGTLYRVIFPMELTVEEVTRAAALSQMFGGALERGLAKDGRYGTLYARPYLFWRYAVRTATSDSVGTLDLEQVENTVWEFSVLRMIEFGTLEAPRQECASYFRRGAEVRAAITNLRDRTAAFLKLHETEAKIAVATKRGDLAAAQALRSQAPPGGYSPLDSFAVAWSVAGHARLLWPDLDVSAYEPFFPDEPSPS